MFKIEFIILKSKYFSFSANIRFSSPVQANQQFNYLYTLKENGTKEKRVVKIELQAIHHNLDPNIFNLFQIFVFQVQVRQISISTFSIPKKKKMVQRNLRQLQALSN